MSGLSTVFADARLVPERQRGRPDRRAMEPPPKRPRHVKRVERDPSIDIFTSNHFFAFPLVSATSVVFGPRPKRSHLRWRRQATASPLREGETSRFSWMLKFPNAGNAPGAAGDPAPQVKKKKALTVRAQWPQPSQAKSGRRLWRASHSKRYLSRTVAPSDTGLTPLAQDQDVPGTSTTRASRSGFKTHPRNPGLRFPVLGGEW